MAFRFPMYDKIPENTRRWGVDEDAMRRATRGDWVVSEKIHGANFCAVVDGAGIRGAKRKSLLADGEDFFNHRRVLERLREPLRHLFALYTAADGPPDQLLVYGELYGGRYPHPEVPEVPGVQAVQTGVWYAPDVEFQAFDVAAVRGGARRWLGFEEARALLLDAGVPCVTPLFIGPYAEALAFSPVFTTGVPARHGLPPLEDNLAEGVVVKPLAAVTLPDGGRPVLKIKHPRFAEDARYHQGERWQTAPVVGASPLVALEWAVVSRLNGPRLESALSKLGPETPAPALADEIISDVLEEVLEVCADDWGRLGDEDRALLKAVLAEEAAALVATSP